MTASDLMAILPLLVLAMMPVIILLTLALERNHRLTVVQTVSGLAAALAILIAQSIMGTTQVTSLLAMDGYARFFIGLILAQAIVIVLLCPAYLKRRGGMAEEFYVLLLLATLGAVVLAASTHLASLFLGMEILSVSLYTMIGYHRRVATSTEAAFKYLILAGTASAFLLFGMALVYANLGTMDFAMIAAATVGPVEGGVILLTGVAMVVVGIGFKLALAPMHLWTPDVYQGAPAPVTAFIATVSKGALFAVLLRFFTQVDLHGNANYVPVLAVLSFIAIFSMFAGNLLAMFQDNIKRMLAYSSISHLGYLLVALLASGPLAKTAAAYYLLAYFVTISGALGVVTVLSKADRDADWLGDYRGLAYRRPVMAGMFAAMLLSLAGIPLTAGFVGKFYVLSAGVESSLWALVLILVVNSVIGLFYYLRVIAAMYMQPPVGAEAAANASAAPSLTAATIAGPGLLTTAVPLGAGVAMAATTLAVVWLGVYPQPIMDVIQALVGKL